jgi:hypothetical protein
MNESVKTFSLVIITICVFIITVIEILKLVDERNSLTMASPGLQSHQPSQQALQASNAPKTSIKFDEMSFDFGELTEGDVVHHTFTFTNSGSNPLIITDAIGSCGCTIPTWPKEPIAPGGRGNIEVQFNSHGKKDIQDKTVTLTANTEQPTVLSIHAKVLEKK